VKRDDLDRNAYDDLEVDLQIAPEHMLALRDEERDLLVDRFHRLIIRARTYRKEGYREAARRYEREAARTRDMIKMLDNPMKVLRFIDRDEDR
jgi:hypothetical protein